MPFDQFPILLPPGTDLGTGVIGELKHISDGSIYSCTGSNTWVKILDSYEDRNPKYLNLNSNELSNKLKNIIKKYKRLKHKPEPSNVGGRRSRKNSNSFVFDYKSMKGN